MRRRPRLIAGMLYVSHEARGNSPHHRDHRGRSEQRRLLRGGAGPAAGQEDRQPGQPDRLPPLLRRREGQPGLRPDLLRVPRRAAGPGGRRDGAPDRLAGRLRTRRSTSGRSGSAPTASSPSATGEGLRFADPEGLDHELLVVEVADAPLIADHPEVPAELALQGFHAVRAYSAAPEASSGLLEALEFEPVDGGAGRRAASSAAASTLYDEPPAERGAAGRRQRPPRRLGLDHRGARGVAREGDLGRRAADAGDRPLLLPARSTSASRAACSSRSPRWARASPSTSRSSTSARSSRCRRTSSTCATRSNRTCARSINPRAPRGVTADFIWRDAGRVVVFRAGGVGEAPSVLAEHGIEPFELLTTERALAGAASAGAAASAVHEVAAGQVPDRRRGAARGGRGPSRREEGGERAARRPRRRARDRHREGDRRGHRRAGRGDPDDDVGGGDDRDPSLPAGAEERARGLVRPALVIADPEAMTSQPEARAAGQLDERARPRRRLPLHAASPTRSRR